MPTAANVRVGKPKSTGGVYAGALAAVAPDDAATALDVGFASLGYVSEEGVTQTKGIETETMVAWGGDEVRVMKTSDALSYSLTLIETSPAVLAEYFGADNVATVTGVTTVSVNGTELPRRSYVFELLDGDSAIRVYLPVAQITNTDDITFVDGEPIGFPITISAYPDEAGNKAYWFLEDVGA
jgi:hypothetical protein